MGGGARRVVRRRRAVVLARAGLRTALVAAIPDGLKAATTTGIGLFLAIIGLQGAGLVVDHPVTLVTLGDVRSAPVLLALGGTLVTAVLVARRVPGALLAGVGLVTVIAWTTGLSPLPDGVVEAPALPRETFAARRAPAFSANVTPTGGSAALTWSF